MYFNNDRYVEAENCLIAAADKGNANAYHVLGFIYFMDQRYSEALEWLKKAAVEGSPEAFYMLGELYENGYEVGQDEHKAREYYEKAAEMGYQEAIEKLKDY